MKTQSAAKAAGLVAGRKETWDSKESGSFFLPRPEKVREREVREKKKSAKRETSQYGRYKAMEARRLSAVSQKLP